MKIQERKKKKCKLFLKENLSEKRTWSKLKIWLQRLVQKEKTQKQQLMRLRNNKNKSICFKNLKRNFSKKSVLMKNTKKIKQLKINLELKNTWNEEKSPKNKKKRKNYLKKNKRKSLILINKFQMEKSQSKNKSKKEKMMLSIEL